MVLVLVLLLCLRDPLPPINGLISLDGEGEKIGVEIEERVWLPVGPEPFATFL